MDPKYAAVNGRRGVEAKCWRYVIGPIIAAHEARKRTEPNDQRIANLRGRRERTGKRKKQITKQAAAPILQPANTRRRSQRLRANQASSSSLLLGAGKGAPSLSIVGSLTYPPLPNGFKLLIDVKRPDCCEVLTGISGSLLDQPREFIDSRNEDEAMANRYLVFGFERDGYICDSVVRCAQCGWWYMWE